MKTNMCDSCITIGWDYVGNKNPDAEDNTEAQINFMLTVGGTIADHQCDHVVEPEILCDCGCRGR